MNTSEMKGLIFVLFSVKSLMRVVSLKALLLINTAKRSFAYEAVQMCLFLMRADKLHLLFEQDTFISVNNC